MKIQLLIKCLIFLLLGNILSQNALAQSDNTTSSLNQKEIYFDFGKHEVRPEDRQMLDSIYNVLKDNEYVILKITAHTDAIGDDESNQLLSQQRAASVQTYLISKGIPNSAIEVAVYGENAPVSDNVTAQGRQRNRRATLELIQQNIPEKTTTKPTPLEAVNKLDKKKSSSPINQEMGLVEGTVVDKATGQPIQATVIVRGKTFRDSIATDETGYFKKEVPVNTVVGVDVYAHGYFFETRMLKVSLKPLPAIEIKLPAAQLGKTAEIKNLFFVGNQAVLLNKSEPELPKVLKFMQVNKGLKIEIGGHVNYPLTNFKAAGKFEQELSDSRAIMVAKYLLENGISKDRITTKGYSNTEMVFPFARKADEMERNRRVEIKVIE